MKHSGQQHVWVNASRHTTNRMRLLGTSEKESSKIKIWQKALKAQRKNDLVERLRRTSVRNAAPRNEQTVRG